MIVTPAFPEPPQPLTQAFQKYEHLRFGCAQRERGETALLTIVSYVAAAIAAFVIHFFLPHAPFGRIVTFIILLPMTLMTTESFHSHEYRKIQQELTADGFCDFLDGAGEAPTIDNIQSLFRRYNDQLRVSV